jgi:aminocarboxymuconate-semialdehyde decarboxylase
VKIDVHAHIVPEPFRHEGDFLIPLEGSDETHRLPNRTVGFDPEMLTSVARRLRDMDGQGVDMHVLSMPPFYFYHLEPERAARVCRSINNTLAQIASQHPSRFVAIADLPMQNPAAAARELERAVRDLEMRGAEIGTNIHGKNLDDPALAPVYAMAQELDVPLFLHPSNVLGQDRLADYYLTNLIGNPTDTAVAAASLIFGGVLKEYPRLKVYLAHGGGSCPYIRGRWEHGWRVRPEGKVRIQRPPSEYFSLLSFDSLAHSGPSLAFLLETVGAERVMLGSDYPFDMRDDDPVKTIASVPRLTDRERALVYGENARALFKIRS